MKAEYPFSAVVGQEQLKLALLLAAVDPTIGGVLIKGERGTAKSTVARGLAALLPAKPVETADSDVGPGVGDGRNAPNAAKVAKAAPFIELPLGATEDRVVGSLDVTKALRDGHTQLRSGVLARADGGVLYVDEVNLLPDHLVDLLLDAAASGWVTVERDGVSAGEAARFVLIGTMNPEEGDLRPQFLDRFGLSVHVEGLGTQELRMAAVAARLLFDANPAAVIEAARGAEDELRRAIIEARGRLQSLLVTSAHLSVVTAICAEQCLDGIRGDLALIKAARALAAWESAREIAPEHIRRAAELVLPHRLRRKSVRSTASSGAMPSLRDGPRANSREWPPAGAAPAGPANAALGRESAGTDAAVTHDGAWGHDSAGGRDATAERDAMRDRGATSGRDGAGDRESIGGCGATHPGDSATNSESAPQMLRTAASAPALKPAPADPEAGVINLVTNSVDRDTSARRGAGSIASGRALRATPYDQTGTLAINETLTAAAARGMRAGDRGLALVTADLMQHERGGSGGSHVLFLVDASASMATRRRLEMAKSAALGLLKSNYQRRDQVALMVFRGVSTNLVVPFTSDIASVERALADVPAGGRTPLARAPSDAAEVLRSRDPALLVVFTDGRANVSIANTDPWQESLAACGPLNDACAGALVIDCEAGPITLGRAGQLAGALHAECVPLSALEETDLTVRIQRRIEALQ